MKETDFALSCKKYIKKETLDHIEQDAKEILNENRFISKEIEKWKMATRNECYEEKMKLNMNEFLIEDYEKI
jgi:hypothetical protein